MRSTLALLSASILSIFANSADATTLTVVSDKPSYVVGETITLTVTGDSQGGAAVSIFGRLTYQAAVTSTVTSSQTQHTTSGNPWILGSLAVGDGFAEVFNQITSDPNFDPTTVQQLQIATATLTADTPGIVSVFWASGTFDLDFFGLTSANQSGILATFTIVPVPEPTTLALLGLGAIGLAFGRHRRA